MDPFALILACSLYPDEHLVRAMMDASSQGNVTFVGDVATLVTYDRPASAADARRLVEELEKQGGRPVVGLLGLPPSWSNRAGKQRADLFDGCLNVQIATAVLADHHRTCERTHTSQTPAPPTSSTLAGSTDVGVRRRAPRVAPPEAIRLCALRRFGAELGFEGYAETVLSYLPRQRLLYAPSGFAAATASSGESSCSCEEGPAPRRRASAAVVPADPDPEPRRRRRQHEPILGPGGAPIID
jgi:hypothetical protein